MSRIERAACAVLLARPSSALALAELTAEEEIGFWSLVFVTVGSALLAAAASLLHFWKSERDEWSILFQSSASIALVSLLCLYVSLMPVLHRVDLFEAFLALYLPSVLLGTMFVGAGMWFRTLCHSRAEIAEFFRQLAERLRKVRKNAERQLREKRARRLQDLRARRMGVAPSYDEIDSGAVKARSSAHNKTRPGSRTGNRSAAKA